MSFPDKQTVLDFIRDNPTATTKQDIARGLHVKGRERAVLREILKELEADGTLERTGKRAWAQADRPPPTGVVQFTHTDDNGDLIGKAVGDNGPFGPDIVYTGLSGKPKGKATEPGEGDRALCKIKQVDGEWQARALTVLEKRLTNSLVGLYSQGPRGGKVTPANRKERREFLIQEADRNGAEDGDLVVTTPKPQGRRQYGPNLGIIREVIGHISDPRSASLLAIHAHGIPVDFPEAALEQARNPKPAPAEREDLTQIPLITIDPHDARDHDDAVFAEQLDDGWRVIVAIADVAAFVTPDSPLDREALKRGNSTYFPDRVVPMLPFELSADACSLREGELRRCMAVEMIFDKAGTKRSHRFIRGMMKSAAKLSYEEAQAAIDGKPGGKAEEMLEPVLNPLWGAYAALAEARDRRSPLDLDLPERRILFTEDGEIDGIITKERLEAHRLIEEFMIQANVAAAESLEKQNSPLIYRVHDTPTDAKIAAFAEFLQTIDMKWNIGQRPQTEHFNRLLGDIDGSDYDQMVTQMVLRTQAQAIYSEENLGHFGLNLVRYAHFTSPIRRYADLIVHRALIASLGLGPDGLSKDMAARLEEMAQHISDTERRSMAAEREATDRYLAIFLADRVGSEFEGRITGVTGAGLFIALAGSGADGFVPISSISDDYWVLDEAAMQIYARGSGKTFGLGQIVRVKLKEVTPLQGGLLLEMLSEPMPAPKGRREARQRADAGHRSRRRPGPGKPTGKRAGKPKFNKKTLPKHKRKRRT
ncbi:ribonuclease R [Hyphomonas sp.]|uniref:ribonuclease R n=1 Tax=Hyphomonas sp. TaxID=87 RepID=UPI0025C51F0A|nr:ribonuclease R [Hyphomonas sp.]